MTTLPSAAQNAEGAEQSGSTDQPAQPPDITANVTSGHRRRLVDLAVCSALILAAVLLTHGLLAHPTSRALALNPADQALVEWFLAYGARFWTGGLHLVTPLLNAPDGINLLANASMTLLGVILAPVTLTLGAPVSFAVAVAGNLAATGIAWYLLLARTLRLHWAAAATGAALCAYGPGMISQDNSHLHISAQWLAPVIVWCVLRLAHTPDLPHLPWLRRVAGTGAVLGVVVCVQLFLSEEVLFLTALTLALFCLAYALAAPKRAGRMFWPLGVGLSVGGALALIGLAHALSTQFSGAQHVPNGPFSPDFFYADLRGFWSVSPLSWFGSPDTARLATNPSEYNTFFGVPLLLVVVALTAWQWRRPAVLAAATAGLVMAALALGPHIVVNGTRTGQSGPYRLLQGLPVIDGALPTRFALALLPIFAIVLATAIDRALRDDRWEVRVLVPAVVALALLPLVPKPFPTVERAPVPRFFTEGHWRDCVRPGGVLVPAPPPKPNKPDKMRWAAAANDAFGIPEGMFIAPYAAGGRASIGIYPRPTSQLFSKVEETGDVPAITATDQTRAREDIAYWHASCVVVADRNQPHADELRRAGEALFGQGQHVVDVTVWRFQPS